MSVHLRLRRSSALWFFAISIANSAHAETESESWEPGEEVAATVKGEARPSDRLRSGDGVYGRFDGDLWLSLAAGVEWSHGVRPALTGRALYYQSAGLVLGYADAFDKDAFVRRDGFVGVELRPLFLPRWALDAQFQNAFLDLTLDSLSFGAGAYLAQTREQSSKAGVELFLGLGLPLLARAGGPWLDVRGFLRPGLDEATRGVSFSLSWYAPVLTPVVK
ncbi:MAG: hypothetical protein ACOY0T_01505 [Myxococcota bacterium]